MKNVILFGMINKMAMTGAPRRHTQAEYLKEASVNSRSYYSFFPYIRDFVQSCGFKGALGVVVADVRELQAKTNGTFLGSEGKTCC